jgi:hypothetical protein
LKPEHLFNGPALVVIDVRQLTYARYWGAKHTMTVQGQQNLTAVEVELYRVDPNKFMGMESA